MLKAAVIGVGIALGVAVGTFAQTQPAPEAQDSSQAQARYKIYLMEGVLERAVANGAANLSRQVRALAPDALFLSGAAQVRGFRIEGYGVFFDVEVPALRPTVAWTLRTMVDDNGASLAQLKAYVQKVQDARDRAELLRAIRRLELQMPSSRAAINSADVGVTAQSVGSLEAQPQAPPRLPVIDPVLLADPAAAYTREVKNALTDAMIENSGALLIGPDEWLTIAARDSEPANRLVPGDAYDLTTWVFRIKGSDLEAFRAGRLALADARKKVEVKEF